ncbi:MAG: metal ABC transporter substrate-binding protein [Chloroflexota bacterium]
MIHQLASRTAVTALAALAIGILGGCSAGKADIVTTNPPITALTQAVAAGTGLQVVGLVGPGVDPHEYEASPEDVRKIGGASVVLRNGLGLDAFLDAPVKSSGQRNVVTVTEGVRVRSVVDAGGQREDDPHVWHDPTNDKIMVANIVKALSTAYPDKASAFQKNGTATQAKLDQVDAEIKQLIATIPAANRKMVTNHDAFGYFIDHFGLTFIGAVIPSVSTQGDASAKQIAELQDTIRREGVKAIFAESSVDPKVASQIAQDTKVKIVADLYGDSLGKPGFGADTVDGMLLQNAKKIVEALK